jgi:hypothetical protein
VAQQAHDLAFLQRAVDAIDGRDAAEMLREALDFDQCGAHRACLRW